METNDVERKAIRATSSKKSKTKKMLRSEARTHPSANRAIQYLLAQKYGCSIEDHQVDALFKRALNAKPLADTYIHLAAIIGEA